MGFNMNQFKNAINNPMIKSLMNSNDPRSTAMNILRNNNIGNTEVANNLMKMLENNDFQGIENYGKNILKSQGVNNEQLTQMMNMFKN